MNSSPVCSPQKTIHKNLKKIVEKHIGTIFAKPIAERKIRAVEQISASITQWKGKVILDSCCGTGESSIRLARQYPEFLVLGIDKSAVRLKKVHVFERQSETECSNVIHFCADIVDFWRLAAEYGWEFYRHYVLYPNPYPKPQHLQRRWHGHPVFPLWKKLSPVTEVRTNWRIYAEEIAYAYTLLGGTSVIEQLNIEKPLTNFEKKYAESGHDLFRVKLYRSSLP